jgi:hypothetical protein
VIDSLSCWAVLSSAIGLGLLYVTTVIGRTGLPPAPQPDPIHSAGSQVTITVEDGDEATEGAHKQSP